MSRERGSGERTGAARAAAEDDCLIRRDAEQ